MISEQPEREPQTFVVTVEKEQFEVDQAFVETHERCSVSLSAAMQKHLFKTLGARGGDTVRMECDGEFIEGWIPAKPNDCIVVERFGNSDGTDGSPD